jgi:hypothetical protein
VSPGPGSSVSWLQDGMPTLTVSRDCEEIEAIDWPRRKIAQLAAEPDP